MAHAQTNNDRRLARSGTDPAEADAMGAEQNKLLVGRLGEGINNGSFEVLDEVADAGWRITWPGCVSSASRREGGRLRAARVPRSLRLVRLRAVAAGWWPGRGRGQDGPGEQGEQGDRLEDQGLDDVGRRDRFLEAE
jgi:hypothetical protein